MEAKDLLDLPWINMNELLRNECKNFIVEGDFENLILEINGKVRSEIGMGWNEEYRFGKNIEEFFHGKNITLSQRTKTDTFDLYSSLEIEKIRKSLLVPDLEIFKEEELKICLEIFDSLSEKEKVAFLKEKEKILIRVTSLASGKKILSKESGNAEFNVRVDSEFRRKVLEIPWIHLKEGLWDKYKKMYMSKEDLRYSIKSICKKIAFETGIAYQEVEKVVKEKNSTLYQMMNDVYDDWGATIRIGINTAQFKEMTEALLVPDLGIFEKEELAKCKKLYDSLSDDRKLKFLMEIGKISIQEQTMVNEEKE